jgi:hypothetical protein
MDPGLGGIKDLQHLRQFLILGEGAPFSLNVEVRKASEPWTADPNRALACGPEFGTRLRILMMAGVGQHDIKRTSAAPDGQ